MLMNGLNLFLDSAVMEVEWKTHVYTLLEVDRGILKEDDGVATSREQKLLASPHATESQCAGRLQENRRGGGVWSRYFRATFGFWLIKW
ncbi:hypothetical protein Taro_032535 [Colocasia esculenta]|uniref:Uncharacterized protein n=1 Tax=Colocasia esculenta TaxID=4460 RepID=A0A843VZE2_COLES|nr:hypothetical protein [Colocasia esculenta]